MEGANKSLSAEINIFIRQMRVTRNLDEKSKQDPFFTLSQFRLVKAAYDKVEDKYKHDLTSRPVFKKKSKVIENGGKEVDFKETMSIDIKMDLRLDGEAMEPVKDEVHFFILHFEDKDYFSSNTIGRAMVDLQLLLVD